MPSAIWRKPTSCSLLLAVLASTLATPAAYAADAGHRWALLVGVDDYAFLRDLQFCARDMHALRDQLIAGGFDKDRVFLLHNAAKDAKYFPTKSNIERQLELLLGIAGPDDLVVVAFSGHGAHLGGVSYLLPADAQFERPPSETFVSMTTVYERLDKSRAALKLFIADACRDDPRPPGSRSASQPLDARSLATTFQRPPQGILVLSSCTPGQQSWEDEQLQHGVFSNYLLKGLQGEADGNRNGKVSLFELYEYAHLETKTFVARSRAVFQTPAVYGQLDGVFELADVTQQLLTNSIGMELALIPSGEFTMGSPEGEEPHYGDELQHRVRITRPFYLGAHEVTVGQFRRFVEATGYKTEPEGDGQGGNGYNASKNVFEGADPKYAWRNLGFAQTDKHPVANVTWSDAVAFCDWLGAAEGATYRLPTEAEWEYACRARAATRYAHGDGAEGLVLVANVSDATARAKFSDWTTLDASDGYVFTAPVGSFRANAFGLHDMHGNVWEWCADWYDGGYYANSPADDPQGPAAGSSCVLRGGGFNNSAVDLRCASRGVAVPTNRHVFIGFRVVRER